MAGAMFAWGHNGKEGVKDCFPQSSFLIARARGSLGFLVPERRQNSAFYVSVESQGLLLTDGQSLAFQPRQEPLMQCRSKTALGILGAQPCPTPTTGTPQMRRGVANPESWCVPSTWDT